MTRCAYCGDICSGARLDEWSEPVCGSDDCLRRAEDDIQRVVDDHREVCAVEERAR